jgi:DNA-directed RNA polymerase beta subunit
MPNDPVGKLPSAKPVAAPAKGVQPPPAFDESSLLKPMDVPGLRRRIYDNVYDSLKATPPVENTRYRLKLDNLQWADPEDWSPAHQKKTFFQGGTMARRLHGDWVLEDVPTNKEVSRKRATVAAVPHLNNRGLFLINGSHWSLSSQTRLDPGMYPRVQANGDIEAYVNPKGGRQHRLSLDPASNQFHMEIGQAKVPLLPILRSLGIEDKQLNEAWGNAILAKNAEKDDPAAVKKLIGKLYDADRLPEGVPDRKLLEDKLHAMKFDPYITNRTLGASHDHYNADAILNATKYLIAMNRGEKPASERDHQAFQHIVGQEHLFGEKAKNIRPLLNQLLWKATGKGNLDHVPSGYLNHHLAETITGTGLGINAQMTNPAEMLDSLYRVTKMGTGGISSLTAVPDESRNVSSSQFHFIDPVVTPESGKAGVDLRFGAGTARDKEGKLYSKFYDPTGRPKWMTPRDTQGMTIGSWESRNSPSGLVPAIKDGVMQRVPKSEVSVWSPPMEHGFSPVANLIPFKSASPPQRAAMGARMTTQALPLIGAESPHVQSGHPEGGSYESHYGQHFGALRADKAGRVTSVSPESVKVRYQDGTQAELPLHKHELYDHSPGRKTHFTQTPTVKAGDIIQPGQLLAHSNYTDKEGNVALGLNARTAWLPARGGGAFEDAFAVSESFAQRMMSDHMAMHSVEDNEAKYGKKEFRSLFPTKYEPKHLLDLDDNGVVKPGTIVKPGQPLILASRKMQAPRTTLVRSPKPVWQDVSEVWDHDYPGEVVDAIQTKNGWRVSVKSAVPMQESDKMCYSDDTEVLTADGWKNVKEVGLTDSVASLDQNGEIEYLSPVALHRYPHNDKMYSLETTQTSLLVTTNHKMYVNRKYAGKYRPDGYRLVEAGQILGKVFKLKRNGKWKGKSPDFFEFPAVVVKAGQSGNGERIIPAIQMPVKTYLMLLGMFLSEGNPFCEANGNYGIDIHQIKPENRSRAFSALDSAGVKYTVCESKIRIYSLQLYTYFDQFGYSWEKFIPNEVFNYSSEDLETLYEWMMWGDGHVVKKTGCHRYTTTSRKLADDFQRLALHLGISANIDSVPASSGVIKGKEYDFRPRFDVSVYQHKNEPEINYAYGKRVSPQKEGLVDYSGDVYCVTLPRNHVLYVRRKDKPVWCGNSGRHGNKGIVTIVPDHEMPVGEDGKPFEVLVSPYTLNSRKNDSQIAETILAKIAAKTGKKYAIPDFHIDDLMKFAKDEAKKNQVGLTETVYDPVTKTKVPGVMTGSQYFMKLHHSVEGKLKERDTGGYDSFDSPARGGEGGAKRMALSDTFALLAHRATDFLRGTKLVRGQRNEHWWEATMSGFTPPTPDVPTQYKRFMHGLTASGINPINENGKIRLMALTDDAVGRLAEDRELQNPRGIDWSKGGDPVPGGLFDRKLHGEDGSRYSKISLFEPLPNPSFEDPVRYTLGLTEKQMRNVIAGKGGMIAGKYTEPKPGEEVPRAYQTGPKALHDALKAVDVDKELQKADDDINGTRKTKRDAAIRRRKYLQGAKDQGIHPSQWMLSKVPVLPPKFRPISKMQGSNTELVSDPNYLYSDLFNANKNLQSLHGKVSDLSEERLALYDSLKAVTGLGDPINPKTQQKNVKGMLKLLLAESPKWSIVQHKLLSSPVDLVGRSTVSPDANLDMDEIGIPKSMANKVYSRFVIKRLVRGGMSPVEAVKAVNDSTPEADRALAAEMKERPVSYHRAPVLHKYGHIGAWPKIVKGDGIRVSPFVIKGLGMDFDGDTANIHVPVYHNEVRDIVDKMMPSKNLLSAKDFAPHYKPEREFHVGLWQATQQQEGRESPRERVFEDSQALRRAFERGEVSIHDKVVVMKH